MVSDDKDVKPRKVKNSGNAAGKEEKAVLPESSKGSPLFDIKSTGFWIGFCETLLIFILVYKNEFSALAIIFAAKEFVRKEKIIENPSYYLLGTFVNVALAMLFAVLSQLEFSILFN